MLYKPERVGENISLKITVVLFFPCIQKTYETYGIFSDIIVLVQVLNCHCSFLTGGITHAI